MSGIWIFVIALIVSGIAGVAAFLRLGKSITVIALITSGLNSGLLGLAICLIWYEKFKNHIHFLLGICVITGLAGASGIDLFLSAFQKGGFIIKFGDEEKDQLMIQTKIGNGKEENDKKAANS